jgi:flavin reductase (DIM6/NTAB) family NADH-FMN oxidoreductase RutF
VTYTSDDAEIVNLSQSLADRKVFVPEEWFDRLASPVSSLALITTVDSLGRVNAAPVATCLRNSHVPTCFEFTMDTRKHTTENVLAVPEFVVNIAPFNRAILEKVQIAALSFPAGVNELDMAGLTALPSRIVAPPRVGECVCHFECRIEWTKLWLETRMTIVGRVVAASVDRECIDADGYVVHEKMQTAQHCGAAYGAKFLGACERVTIANIYNGPDPKTLVAPQAAVGVPGGRKV